MLRSGNDAAVALAEYVGGSVEGFSELMNNKAKELKLNNTHFVTPHGLDNSNHYTTALELAKLTDYAMQNETFAKIVGTKSTSININGYPTQINNTNELLGVLNGVVGVKTGFTNNAGRCLVTEIKRDGMDIITIVLGADTKNDRTKDSVKLIEYTFSNYKMYNVREKIIEKFNDWKSINSNRIQIIKGNGEKLNLSLGEISIDWLPLKDSEIDTLELEFNILTSIEAPIEERTKVGTIVVKIDENIIDTIDILNENKINKKNCFEYFKLCIERFPNLLNIFCNY